MALLNTTLPLHSCHKYVSSPSGPAHFGVSQCYYQIFLDVFFPEVKAGPPIAMPFIAKHETLLAPNWDKAEIHVTRSMTRPIEAGASCTAFISTPLGISSSLLPNHLLIVLLRELADTSYTVSRLVFRLEPVDFLAEPQVLDPPLRFRLSHTEP